MEKSGSAARSVNASYFFVIESQQLLMANSGGGASNRV